MLLTSLGFAACTGLHGVAPWMLWLTSWTRLPTSMQLLDWDSALLHGDVAEPKLRAAFLHAYMPMAYGLVGACLHLGLQRRMQRGSLGGNCGLV